METHVIFTFDANEPKDVFTEDDNFFDDIENKSFELQPIAGAENTEGAPFAHYYEERMNKYGNYEYHYIKTNNA